MSDFEKTAFKLFKEYSDKIVPFFPELKDDLKRSGMPHTIQEYISMGIFVSLMSIVGVVPVFSILFSILFTDFLFGFMMAVMASIGFTAVVFMMVIYYPKLAIGEKSKDIDSSLPFASLYLSTIAGSKLPLYKTFEIFCKFARYGEIVKQINNINEDIKVFGLDTGTALERAVERSPSKKFKELLYGMLSTIRSGANMNIYMKEKSVTFMADYRRSIGEYSRSLTVYVEIYLTSIVLGSIFFTVLTAIISGISSSGAGQGIILLQFFLIFVFMPVISVMFIFMIKSATPGGE